MGFWSSLGRGLRSAASAVAGFIFGRPEAANPTLVDIAARQQAEQARIAAENATKAAQDLLAQIQRNSEQEAERARLRQEEADRASARAAREADDLKERMRQAEDAANQARAAADKAASDAREDAARFAREAREAQEHAQRVREDAEREMNATRERAERAQRAADEQRRAAEEGKTRAEEAARAAAEEARKAQEAKAEADRRLKEGIQPVVTPSLEEVAAAKRRIQYREDCFHFAIAGISGSGKSSLVNAFRGLRSRDPGAAAVGVTETTLQMCRYAGANPADPFAWYDIPGAGTIRCRDWQYFNDQGLYVFDCLVVLFDNRFTMTDIAILVNARRFNIPTYIVRSKADQHIRNVMAEMGYDSDEEDEDAGRRNRLYKAARDQFVAQTRESVRTNLDHANLPNQRVYIVTSATLLTLVQDKSPRKAIDEVDLLNDLYTEAYRRRAARTAQNAANGTGPGR